MSGIWGGGFINHVAKDPRLGSARFIIGGDTSGLHRSRDDGDLWTVSNGGITESSQDSIAAIAFRLPPNNAAVYAAFGVGTPASSGILRSTNGGATWRAIPVAEGSPVPVFQGHGPGGRAAYQVGEAPRATGKLIALDEPGGGLRHIYVGTFGTGVMRSDDGGRNWTTVALGEDASNLHCTFLVGEGTEHGCFITSVLLSPIPGEADTLYVSVHGGDPSTCGGDGICGGVFRISNADCLGGGCADITTDRLDADPQPKDGEELAFMGTTLLCACGADGFYKKRQQDPSLVQRSASLAFDLGRRTSYAAVASRGSSIFLGAYNPACETIGRRETCHTTYRSTDLGVNWTDLAFDVPIENIDLTVAGTEVEWWEGSKRESLIDGKGFNVSSIALTDDPTPVVMVAGHSGVWKTTDADQLHWQPAVQGIGATTNNDVVADRNNPGYVYVGNTDWSVFASAGSLAPGTVVQTQTPIAENPNKATGFALAVDEQDLAPPSDVYLAAGLSGPTDLDVDTGDVYLNPDPVTQPWQSLGLVTDGSCGDRLTPRVIGLAVGRPNADDAPALYAATDGCGLYRRKDGNWERIGQATAMFSTEDFLFNFAHISYPNSLARVLYVLDRKTGNVWRSQDAGNSWSTGPIFTIPAGERAFDIGWMAADPNTLGTNVVWVATGDVAGLHRLTCSVQCQSPASWTDQPDFVEVANPGPVAIVPCSDPCTSVVYVASRAVPDDPAHPPGLYKSTPDEDFCNVVAGSGFYRGAATFPVQLAVSPSVSEMVTAYLTTVGAGTIVVEDGSSSTCT